MMRIVNKYIVLLATVLFVIPLHAQYKVIESSSKKAPSWIGVSQSDYIIVSSEGGSLDDAKVKCLEYIKQSIITSVAVNISSTEKFSESVEMVGESMNANRKYESEIESIAGSLPFISGILIDDAEIYWKKLYNKKDKSYKYEVHAKYPFSSIRRGELVSEFMAQDKEQYDKYLSLKDAFDTFDNVEFIDQAISNLHALRKYFFDAKRQAEVDALVNNYRRLYKAISLLPYSEKLGEIVYYLELDGRKVTCSRKPTVKSQYATNIQVIPNEDKTYTLTYNYDYCLPEDDNTIEVIQKFASGSVKNTFYFDPPKK